MDDARKARAAKRIGYAGLLTAAAAISVISLWGPLVLATGGELATVLPYIPFLWGLAIAGWLVWLRTHLRLRKARRAPQDNGACGENPP